MLHWLSEAQSSNTYIESNSNTQNSCKDPMIKVPRDFQRFLSVISLGETLNDAAHNLHIIKDILKKSKSQCNRFNLKILMYPQTQHPIFKTYTSPTKPPLGPSSCVIISLTIFKMYQNITTTYR